MFTKHGPGWPRMAPDAGSAGAMTEAEIAGEGQTAEQGGTNQEQAEASPEWDTWIAGQPDQVRALIDSHVRGLKTALDKERQARSSLSHERTDLAKQRSDLANQLRQATKSVQEGSEARKTLEQMSAKLEQAELRARFYEEGVKPEIGCTNPRMAMLAAQELDAIDSKGRIGWETIKGAFPEIFRQPRQPQGNAGAGTGAPPPANVGNAMNQMIRRAAGR